MARRPFSPFLAASQGMTTREAIRAFPEVQEQLSDTAFLAVGIGFSGQADRTNE
jgi:hypothetical protein